MVFVNQFIFGVMRNKMAAVAAMLLLAGCGNVDGPGDKDFVGTWKVTSVGGYALPVIARTGPDGSIHTLYSSMTLSVDSKGIATFSYDVSDLDDIDDSVDVHEQCTSVATTEIRRGVLTLHWLADTPQSCSKESVDGETFTKNGDELSYSWDNYAAVLKRMD